MIRTAAVLAASVLLTSCNVAEPTGAKTASPTRSPSTMVRQPAASTRPTASVQLESLEDFAKRIKVDCTRKGQNLDCIGGKPENGDIYDVEMTPDCGPDGFFGGVASETGTELRDALPPKDDVTTAVLGQGQLVCIQATGSVGQDPSYFYVVAVPVANVAACRGNRLCSLYGDRHSKGWRLDTKTCGIASNGRPTDACPQGWARREDIEDFSNGM